MTWLEGMTRRVGGRMVRMVTRMMTPSGTTVGIMS